MARILIAEDEERISSFLERGLRAHGFATEVVTDGEQALTEARSGRFDLLILDLGLPGMDGLEALRTLRGEGRRLPVVILTARDSVGDTIVGLEGGADDYITKPFRFDELIARIRIRMHPDLRGEASVLRVGDMALDLRARCAVVGQAAVPLSAREFALAEVFFRHPGQALTREELLSRVWDYDFDPGSNIIDVYVGYLRRKLGKRRISSVRGVGYRFETAPPMNGPAERP